MTTGPIDANKLEAMAKEMPDECFLKGSGVLKLIGAIRQLERAALASRPPAETTGERERELCATIGAMQAQIDALKGDMAARGAGDTELLDWLEESGHAYTTVSGKWVFSDQPFGDSGMTLREAIATARQQG
jgi:hypothetical protein